jgi:integrase
MGGHFRALSYADMPSFLKTLEGETDAISALCMRFTILTVARTKESTACRWADIDWANRTRAIEILKGGREPRQHLIPLSDQALELLRGLLVDGKPTSKFVFPARNRPDHLGSNAMRDLLTRTGWLDRTTTHGIRAAFKTWATERTNYPREVVELCLSHAQGDPLERAYQARRHPREAPAPDAGVGGILRAWPAAGRQRGCDPRVTPHSGGLLRKAGRSPSDWPFLF